MTSTSLTFLVRPWSALRAWVLLSLVQSWQGKCAVAVMISGAFLASGSVAQADRFASGWSKDHASSVRLISGSPVALGQPLRAGIEIQLDEGYKTYWRNPGESGLRPRFDWLGSSNVQDIQVLWPAPVRFSDGAGSSIGYDRSVILPLIVTPKDPQRPVGLSLVIDYGVCKTLCIPANGRASLMLPTIGMSPYQPQLSAFEAKVPLSRQVAVALSLQSDPLRLIAKTQQPFDAPAALFVDSLEGWELGEPQVIQPSSFLEWTIPVYATPPKDRVSQSGLSFRLILVQNGRAFETEAPLVLP